MWPFKPSNKRIARDALAKLGYTLVDGYATKPCYNCQNHIHIKSIVVLTTETLPLGQVIETKEIQSFWYCASCHAIS